MFRDKCEDLPGTLGRGVPNLCPPHLPLHCDDGSCQPIDGECPEDFADRSLAERKQMAAASVEDNDGELVHCYCDTLSYTKQSTEDLCYDYYKAQATAQGWIYGAAATVAAVNVSSAAPATRTHASHDGPNLSPPHPSE